MDDSYREARLLAISHIGISHKSSGTVYNFLLRKGISGEVAQSVVHQLSTDGYIDDIRMARSIIAKRSGRSTESRSVLFRRMLQAGISREAMDAIKDEAPEDRDSITVLTDAKLMPDLMRQISLDSFDADIWMNKAFRFLVSKGYSPSLSIDTLRNRIRDVE